MAETVNKKTKYSDVKDILEQIPGAEVNEKAGGKLRFPIYHNPRMLETPIDALELSVRSYNCLKRANINTIGDFINRITSSSDLKTIRNCGSTSVAEIMNSLFAYQYSVLDEKGKVEFLRRVVEDSAVGQ